MKVVKCINRCFIVSTASDAMRKNILSRKIWAEDTTHTGALRNSRKHIARNDEGRISFGRSNMGGVKCKDFKEIS
jgi:hypothetical protein